MKLARLLESLENAIVEATGALAVTINDVNASVAELRLRFFNLVELGTLLRALTNLKRLLKQYGLSARNPQLEAIQDSLELVIEVVEAKTTDLYHT